MARLRPRLQELLDALLDEMVDHPLPVDFRERIFPLPALVICELLGVPYSDRDDFRRWSDDAARLDDEARSVAGLGALWQYMTQLVERQAAPPGPDVLSDLVAAEADVPIRTRWPCGERGCSSPVTRPRSRLLFATLLIRLPELRLAVPIDELRLRSQLLTGGLESLPVTW